MPHPAGELTMNHFNGRVALVTGAASGIGLALARRCATEGMKVVLADVEADALLRARKEVDAPGRDVAAVVIDVSKAADMDHLARQTMERFGGVHLLFNNAGVGVGNALWDYTLADWEWVINVNLWGVIHAIRTFVPLMLRQNTDCHIVNTASIAGLLSGRGMGIYRMTKHAVVSLSETLYCDLQTTGSPIGVSVLCPGFVRTRIMESERNRPARLANTSPTVAPAPWQQAVRQSFRDSIAHGTPPDEIADCVFTAIRNGTFYVLPHPEFKEQIRERVERILSDRNPAIPQMPQ
jgi:NAD(P)-dependent dehydrogenase (short-subunit alcohol dehydrogenase family)